MLAANLLWIILELVLSFYLNRFESTDDYPVEIGLCLIYKWTQEDVQKGDIASVNIIGKTLSNGIAFQSE